MSIVTTVPAIFVDTIFADKYDGKLYQAIKVNPKNIKSRDIQGKTWNVPWTRTREATADERERYETQASKPEPLSTDMFLRIGNVVQFRAPSNSSQRGYFVVTKSTPNGWSLFRLGGDIGSRYFRGVPASLVEKIEEGAVIIKNV